MIRRDTDQILSYYQSEHAGRSDSVHDHEYHEEQRPKLDRRTSFASSNSSQYSTDSVARLSADASAEFPVPQPASHSQHTRRPSVPTQESVDRRRLAIVEVEPSLPPSISRKGSSKSKDISNQPGVFLSSSALLSRRGLQVNGLALVAPPDASPSTYTDLTPPPTAPLFPERAGNPHPPTGHHHSHSASETIGLPSRPQHRLARDVGIIGMGSPQATAAASGKGVAAETSSRSTTARDKDGLQVPIFQTPTKSRSPSPAAHTPELTDSAATSFNESLQATPGNLLDNGERDQARTPCIGEEKDIQQPVVGPVVVELESDYVIRKTALPVASGLSSPASQYTNTSSPSSTYMSYQPGLHSTAGPLPTPPAFGSETYRQSTSGPPPRPPRTPRTPLPEGASLPAQTRRDLEVLKESLQLPKSVSAVLASRSSSRLGTAGDGLKVREDSDVSGRYVQLLVTTLVV